MKHEAEKKCAHSSKNCSGLACSLTRMPVAIGNALLCTTWTPEVYKCTRMERLGQLNCTRAKEVYVRYTSSFTAQSQNLATHIVHKKCTSAGNSWECTYCFCVDGRSEEIMKEVVNLAKMMNSAQKINSQGAEVQGDN